MIDIIGRIGFAALLSAGLAGCVRPAEERVVSERHVGLESVEGLSLQVEDGMAAVRELLPDRVMLWAGAPVLRLGFESDVPREIRLEVRNCMPDAQLRQADGTWLLPVEKPRATWCVFALSLVGGASNLLIAPPDWEQESSYRFADMGDIQKAMDSVDEVFAKISNTPDLRFVMSTGDVVERGEIAEYAFFQQQLAALDIPFFSTVGNHELTIDATRWLERFGRYSVHFTFKGVAFSFVDSGNASLDPKLYEKLDQWLEASKDRIHIFGTHYPPLDPVGVRNGGFRSRNEASKLLVKLARGNVDLTLYGHIHSLYEFENANIPAYISGGGGALPERFDNIGRHFLVIEVDPVANEVQSVETVHVD